MSERYAQALRRMRYRGPGRRCREHEAGTARWWWNRYTHLIRYRALTGDVDTAGKVMLDLADLVVSPGVAGRDGLREWQALDLLRDRVVLAPDKPQWAKDVGDPDHRWWWGSSLAFGTWKAAHDHVLWRQQGAPWKGGAA